MTEFYSAGVVTIGGVEFGEPDGESTFGLLLGRHGSTTATAAMMVARESFDRLLLLLTRTRGASEATLARRVLYGGRKGRSAWRRLRARGYNAVARVEGVVVPVTVQL